MRAFRMTLALMIAGCVARAIGAYAADEEKPPVYKLTVSPAAEPHPALKYRLLVPPVEQVQGNAATMYYKVLAQLGSDPMDMLERAIRDEKKEAALFDSPLSELPQDEADRFTNWLDAGRLWGGDSDWLTRATQCDYCNWEDGIRARGVFTMLPQAQKSRDLARAIALRARLQMARGQLDDSIGTMRWGYCLSRHLGEGPTLVHALVGLAIEGLMDEQVRTLIAQDRSPNVYWALSELAAEPVSVRQALSYETQVWEFSIHELPDLDRHVLTGADAYTLTKRVFEMGPMARKGRQPTELLPLDVRIASWTVKLYPQAREYLSNHGHSARKIDEMPFYQTVLLYRWLQYLQLRDDYFKWAVLPDDQLRETLLSVQDSIDKRISRGEGEPFTEALPPIWVPVFSRIRHQRQTELLRTVEALRMYAAEHGQWPAALDEITRVPVPLDPWFQQPFKYSVNDNVAILSAPEPTGQAAVDLQQRWQISAAWVVAGAATYELTLRKPK